MNTFKKGAFAALAMLLLAGCQATRGIHPTTDADWARPVLPGETRVWLPMDPEKWTKRSADTARYAKQEFFCKPLACKSELGLVVFQAYPGMARNPDDDALRNWIREGVEKNAIITKGPTLGRTRSFKSLSYSAQREREGRRIYIVAIAISAGTLLNAITSMSYDEAEARKNLAEAIGRLKLDDGGPRVPPR
jgi:hypothetical protein